MSEEVFVFPLSLSQHRLWITDQLRPLNSIYNLSAVIPLETTVNITLLERSCNYVVNRHDALRTTFELINDVPMQVVKPKAHIPLKVINVEGATDHERLSEASLILSDEAGQPLDLEAGPLVRTTLVSLSPARAYFLVTMHHIISDADSMRIFLSDVQECYECALRGRTPDLPDLPIQYPDYAVWQRERFSDDSLGHDLQFWMDALSGLPTVEMPTDFPRPLDPTFRCDQVRIELDPETVRALSEVAVRHGATLFMALLAGFYALLQRYTGQDDLSVGTPVSGRSHLELEGVIGFFVNSIVLRVDLSCTPTFEELLKRVRAVALDGFAHQELPFELLVEKLKPPRDVSRNPLFQIIFQLHHVKSAPAPARSQSQPDVRAHSSPVDLALTLWEGQETVWGVLQYATDLFRRSTAQRFVEHYCNLLRGAAARPTAPVARLPLLSDAERRQILVESNDAATTKTDGPLIHECVEAWACERGSAPAVVTSAGALTYEYLNLKADGLARRLRDHGVGRETRVAAAIERSASAIIAAVAIWKAGGIYIPLDPNYPTERLRFMLEDSAASLLLTSATTPDYLLADDIRKLTVDDSLDDIERRDEDLPAHVSARDAAYLIYTSGSTGLPKGVLLEHRGLANVIEAQKLLLPVTPQSRVLQFSSLCFDSSVFEMALAFGAGAALCIPAQDDRIPGSYGFAATLARMNVDTVVMPPPAVAALDPSECATLRTIMFAGDVCPADLAQAWLNGRRVFNLYGPTEATIWATFAELTGGGKPPIGRVIPNTRAYLLDKFGNLVPPGVYGELHLSGVGLARGYLNRPDQTRERFIPNPFDTHEDYRTLYRTGDLCLYRDDGVMEYAGRLDSQVKVRGFRIELGEVEAAMRSHPAVKDSCAVIQDHASSARLVAYAVIRDGEGTNAHAADALRAHLRRSLPDYMIPSSIFIIGEIPLTPNGKIDRARLTEGGAVDSRTDQSLDLPRSPLERDICSVYQEVLKLDRVGVNESFFDLGGHSLLAVQAQKRLEDRLQARIKVTALFQHATPAALASYLAAAVSPVGGLRNTDELSHELGAASLPAAREVRND